jgi:hypothetical protein
MMNRKQTTYLLIVFLVSAVWLGCKDKGVDALPNPYDDPKELESHDRVFTDEKELELSSISGLHQYIFKPTCANSGCHDGNFEPDFRTVQSTYNTLVNQPIIKNDQSDPLEWRVVPGDADKSMLVRRLEEDLNGNSGIMPLSLEPDSDWPTYKSEYILRIKNWINGGALDMEGNPPDPTDFPPQVVGVLATQLGDIVVRGGQFKPIAVSKSAGPATIWISLKDDLFSPSELTDVGVDTTMNPSAFPQLPIPMTYQASPMTHKGFKTESESYQYSVTMNLSQYNRGDIIWMRFYASDGGRTAINPNQNSLYDFQYYSAIKIVN